MRVVDRDRARRALLPRGFAGQFIVGNGYSRAVLEQAGIGDADAFVAVTSGDNSNIVGARTAKETYRVPIVVARIYDPRRADIYRDLGIPTVASVRWTVNQIHQMLLHRHLTPELHLRQRRDPAGPRAGTRLPRWPAAPPSSTSTARSGSSR